MSVPGTASRQMEIIAHEVLAGVKLQGVSIAALGDRQDIGGVVHVGVAADDIGDRRQIDHVARGKSVDRCGEQRLRLPREFELAIGIERDRAAAAVKICQRQRHTARERQSWHPTGQ